MMPAAVASVAVQPKPEEVLAALARVLESRHFRESAQLRAFLNYVVQESLAGRRDTLKEYLVGCQVFGRRPDYDPRQDGIVRVQATALRKRLDKYYGDEGCGDAVIIELPRGGYVPRFGYAQPKPVPALPATPDRSHRIGLTVAFLLGALLALAIARRPAPTPAFQETTATAADLPQLWQPFFHPGARNLVAFGVPLFYSYSANGLMIRDVNVNVPEQGAGSLIAAISRQFQIMPAPADDIYTGVGEVVATHLIGNFFASRGVPVRVSSARSIGSSDLRDHNLVVVSSLRFQTLLREMNLPADFEFSGASTELIRNWRPLAGEKSEYRFESGAGVSTSYAVVSTWPGPSPGRRILSIGGVHTWATQAATEFLLDPAHLRQVAAAMARSGPPSSAFQILLRVEGRGNQSQKVEYVTHHYLR